MKRIISAVLLLMLVAAALVGCNGAPAHFTGEWKFSKITSAKFVPNVDDSTLEFLKEAYNAETEEAVLKTVKDKLVSDKTFDVFYLNFDGKKAYTYDPIMEREATWVLYQTEENKGFISFYAELDVNEGNPDPVVCPEIVYEADKDTMYITLNVYTEFMLTLELKR
jgi:hypothetical protein